MLKVMLDVNALVDYFVRRNNAYDDMQELLARLSDKQISFMVTPTSLTTAYYLIKGTVKRQLVAEAGESPEVAAAFADEYAWNCIGLVRDFGVVPSEGLVDSEMAACLRKVHPDFEDNLMVAVAMRCDVDYIVTRDEVLTRHSSVHCVTPRQLLDLLDIVA